MIDQEEIKSVFEYKEGNLYWKKRLATSIKIGDLAGCIRNTDQYHVIRYKNKMNYAHRLIFLYHHGYLPKFLDHINGIKTDNRIENLRECTNQQNTFNHKLRIDNTTGYKHIYKQINSKKYRVRIQINGKNIEFGSYYDINVAKFVADTMRNKYHGKFANSGEQK